MKLHTGYRCPIPQCDKVFWASRSGWDSHVASLAKHSAWHPDVRDGEERKDLFRQEYPGWFDLPKGTEYRCPIPQCDKVFWASRSGWDSHVVSLAEHPAWHPDIRDGKERKDLFKQEYPGWFDLPKSTEYRCPIPQCDKVFRVSRSGWDSHVASPAKHPAWHPDVRDGKERKDLFRQEYPGCFDRPSGRPG